MFKKSKGFTLIELMIVIAIIGILAAIAIPNFISYRNKSFCSRAESDANSISAAIADYFSVASRTNLPTISDLGITISNGTSAANITGDPNTTITVTVDDTSGRCPQDYREGTEGWESGANGNTYTKNIR
jgi:prepilin-type N-terminal cleavage/methylation domain-containing protein